MRVFAILNQKGGSGKTTSTINLGAALAELGRHVLVLDLYPQASATHWLGADEGDGIYQVIVDRCQVGPFVRTQPSTGLTWCLRPRNSPSSEALRASIGQWP